MKEDGEDQLYRLCEKCVSIIWDQGKGIILHKIKRRKANWIGHILRRELPSKTFTESKIEETAKGGRKREQLMDGLKNTRKYRKLKGKH